MALDLGVEVVDEGGEVGFEQLGDGANCGGVVVGPADVGLQLLVAGEEASLSMAFLMNDPIGVVVIDRSRGNEAHAPSLRGQDAGEDAWAFMAPLELAPSRGHPVESPESYDPRHVEARTSEETRGSVRIPLTPDERPVWSWNYQAHDGSGNARLRKPSQARGACVGFFCFLDRRTSRVGNPSIDGPVFPLASPTGLEFWHAARRDRPGTPATFSNPAGNSIRTCVIDGDFRVAGYMRDGFDMDCAVFLPNKEVSPCWS